MKEIWKPIEGTNGKYEVSNTGKVRSLNYGGHGYVKELSPAKDHKGYYRVKIMRENAAYTAKVHRLVAQAFISNPENKPEVNHINGVKTDNRAENLEWMTAHENTLHAYKSGLKEKTRERCRIMGLTKGRIELEAAREKRKTPVIATRLIDGKTFEYGSQSEAAQKTGAPQGNIFKVLIGERKSANGFAFRYKGVVSK